MALNNDGDFGYGSASFDESDLSNSELLSPSSRDENKSIATQNQKGNQGYSYAAVEFRPLIITEEGGLAAPVETRHPEILQREKGDDSQNVNHMDTGSSEAACNGTDYAYTGNEFRPLIVTKEGGIASTVGERKPSHGSGSDNHNDEAVPKDLRKMPLPYEEVEVVDGEYDRSNVKFAPVLEDCMNPRNVPSDVSADYVYSAVPDEDAPGTDGSLRMESTCPLYVSDTPNTQSNAEQLYAAVQKDQKQIHGTPVSGPCDLPQQEKTGSLPPALPPRAPSLERDFDTYEAITGELQSMIQACKEIEPSARPGRLPSEEKASSDGECKAAQRKGPPPVPKPYAGPGLASVVKKEAAKEDVDLEDGRYIVMWSRNKNYNVHVQKDHHC